MFKNVECRLVILLMVFIAVLSCDKEINKKKIYYLLPTLIDEFQTESQRALERIFGDMGYQMVSFNANNESERQMRQFEVAISERPSAIILNAVDFASEGLPKTIRKAREAGIRVFIYDRPIPNVEVDFTSIPDGQDIGRKAASAVVDLLRARRGGPTGKILHIMGDPGDNYSTDVRKGFEVEMLPWRDIKVFSRAAIGWDPANAKRIAERQLTSTLDRDIDLIFAHAALLTTPIISLLQDRGKHPGDILLISSNGAPTALKNIRRGWQQAEVEQPLYAQVYGLAEFFEQVINGRASELKAGRYEISHVPGVTAELAIEREGPVLKLPGSTITCTNVADRRFWGNLIPSGAKISTESSVRMIIATCEIQL